MSEQMSDQMSVKCLIFTDLSETDLSVLVILLMCATPPFAFMQALYQ
jgi:hypothetical protein